MKGIYCKEDFLRMAKELHGDKYTYKNSVFEYGYRKKIVVTCPKHGDFNILVESFLHDGKEKCKLCKQDKERLTLEEFIIKSRKIHGDKYDYSKVEYVNTSTKVCIICPKHGEFWQTPNDHLNGRGCRKCQYEKGYKKNGNLKFNTKTIEEFIKQAHKIHGDKYDYSKVNYVNTKTKICIICPEHGEFYQIPSHHLNGCGCRKCGNIYGGNKRRKTQEQFINDCNRIHGDKYNYSNTIYTRDCDNVIVTCPIHGDFEIKANKLMNGHGCEKCSESNLERDVRIMLKNKNILYINEKKFDWLIFNDKMKLDFYIPSLNIAIECQGGQHFYSKFFFGGNEGFEKTKLRDAKKHELCKEHNIDIIYFCEEKDRKQIPFGNNVYSEENVVFSIEELCNKIGI